MKHLIRFMILAVLAPSFACAQVILFSDDFNNGARPEWTIANGGWVAENGHMRVTSSCGFQQCNPNLYAGGSLQSDYLVSFDFLVTQAFTYHGSGVGCYIALSNPNEPYEGVTNGYSVGFGWSPDGVHANANCQIQRLDNSVMTPLADTSSPNNWIEPGIVYHLKLGRLGTDLVAKKWTEGEPEPDWQTSVTDQTYSSGYWMPIFWNNVGWIDNFVVEGFGTVPTEATTWGSVKSLFR